MRKLVFASGEVHRVTGPGPRRGDGATFGALSVEGDLYSRPRPHVRGPTIIPIPARRCRP
jgi:hypothetical protein